MENYGFRWTNDLVAIITLVFALTYLFVGQGGKAFGKSCRNFEREKNQQQVLDDGAEFRMEEHEHVD